jgi:hypothetical protein
MNDAEFKAVALFLLAAIEAKVEELQAELAADVLERQRMYDEICRLLRAANDEGEWWKQGPPQED